MRGDTLVRKESPPLPAMHSVRQPPVRLEYKERRGEVLPGCLCSSLKLAALWLCETLLVPVPSQPFGPLVSSTDGSLGDVGAECGY